MTQKTTDTDLLRFTREASFSHEIDVYADAMQITVDRALAESIRKMQQAVIENNAYKMEQFCYLGQWLDDGEPADINTDCDTLNVCNDAFWFKAYVKHTNVVIRGDRIPIADLEPLFQEAA